MVALLIGFLQFFFCSYDACSFLLIVPFCKFLRKIFVIWITFPYMDNFLSESSSRDISSWNIITFYMYILLYYFLSEISLILLSEDIKTYQDSIFSSGECLWICYCSLTLTAPRGGEGHNVPLSVFWLLYFEAHFILIFL